MRWWSTDYVVPGRIAMHHELGLAVPFPIGLQGGDTYRIKAVGVGLENEPISLKNVCSAHTGARTSVVSSNRQEE